MSDAQYTPISETPSVKFSPEGALRALSADALSPDECLALYIIGKLALQHTWSRTQLFGGGNTLEVLMGEIAAAVREARPMLEGVAS